jgi:hypothetical protein
MPPPCPAVLTRLHDQARDLPAPALLMLLVRAGSGFYVYQKSSVMIPSLIHHPDSDSFRERQAATFRLQ